MKDKTEGNYVPELSKDFDSILKDVGGFGRYQMKMSLLVVIPTAFVIGLQLSTRMFQTVVPDHWCSVPGRGNTTYSEEQWKNITIPYSEDTQSYSQCEAYDIYWQHGRPHATNTSHKCSSWEYDRSDVEETVATSFDWVCGKELRSVHMLSIGSIGSSIGTLLLPYFADRYTGRRPMFFVAVGISSVSSFAALFLSSFAGQMVVRFITGIAFQSNYQMCYLIALEFIPPEYRALTAFLSFTAWTLSMCFTSVLAYWLSNWRYLIVAGLIGDLYMFSLWWFLPESPRWLLSKNRVDETIQGLLKVAEANKTSDSVQEEVLLKELSTIEDADEINVSIRSILDYPKFRFRALLLLLVSSSSFLGYGILVYDIDVIPNRYFLNFFIMSLAELPGGAIAWISCQYLGRRFTSIVSYMLLGIFSVAALFYLNQKTALIVIVGIMKCFLTSAVFVFYLQATELYPTTLRGTGMGSIAVFGTATITAAPYIINTSLGPVLSYSVILAVSVIGILFSLPLPETLGLPLPQTLSEAENLGSSRPLTKWVHHWNHHKYKQVPTSEL